MFIFIIGFGIIAAIGIWLCTASNDEIVDASEKVGEGLAKSGESTQLLPPFV
jgi:hypothetical protein